MGSFLDAHVDLALPVRRGETAETITAAERQRLARQLAVVMATLTFPRRLGTEVSAEELAADKRTARRVAHVLSKLLLSWGGEPSSYTANVKREAAIIKWDVWWAEHRLWLQARERYIATWCHKAGQNGDLRWSKSAIVRLDNELKWLSYAIR